MAGMVKLWVLAIMADMVSLMSGIASLAFTVVGIFSSLLSGPHGAEYGKKFCYFAAALCFLYANFRTWAIEHKKVVSGSPDFILNVDGVRWESMENDSSTAMVFAVHLLNRGAPSVTMGWQAMFEMGEHKEVMESFYITSPWILRNGDETVTVQQADQISFKTGKRRVETGEAKTGRIFFKLKVSRHAQLATAQFKVTVSFNDFRSVRFSGVFVPSPLPLKGVSLYPSEQGGRLSKLPELASYTPELPPREDGT